MNRAKDGRATRVDRRLATHQLHAGGDAALLISDLAGGPIILCSAATEPERDRIGRAVGARVELPGVPDAAGARWRTRHERKAPMQPAEAGMQSAMTGEAP